MSFPDISWEQISEILPNNSFPLEKESWVFSFSGGADSVACFYGALLWLENFFPDKKKEIMITLMYIDHQLNYSQTQQKERMKIIEQAYHWAKSKTFNIQLCQKKISPQRFQNKSRYSFEACASRLRKKVFLRLSRKEESIAVFIGHSLSDWFETMMMRLQRGSSWQKIYPFDFIEWQQGILWCRPLAMTLGSEVRETLSKHKIDFWEDPENTDTTIERNFVRQSFPIYRPAGLKKTAGFLLQEKREQKKLFAKKTSNITYHWHGNREVRLVFEQFSSLPLQEQKELIIYFLQELGLSPLSANLQQLITKLPFSFSSFVVEKENWYGNIFLVLRRGNSHLSFLPTPKNSARSLIPQETILQKYGRKKIKKIFSEFQISNRQKKWIKVQKKDNEVFAIDMQALGLPIIYKEKRTNEK